MSTWQTVVGMESPASAENSHRMRVRWTEPDTEESLSSAESTELELDQLPLLGTTEKRSYPPKFLKKFILFFNTCKGHPHVRKKQESEVPHV